MALVEIEIPPRSAYVRVARLAVSSLARASELDDERVDDLKIAVSEACANAVLATERAGREDPVTISWAEGDGEIIVEVGDRGGLEEEGDDTTGGLPVRRVLSAALLETLVDECTIENRFGGGTNAKLVIRR